MRREGMTLHWLMCATWPLSLIVVATYGLSHGTLPEAALLTVGWLMASGIVLFFTAPPRLQHNEAGGDVKLSLFLLVVAAIVAVAVASGWVF